MGQAKRKTDYLEMTLEERLTRLEQENAVLRQELAKFQLETEESLLFVTKKITNSTLFSEAKTVLSRLAHLEQQQLGLVLRLDRYTSALGFGILRKVRRAIKRLPPPE